jgi:cell division protein FtsW
MAAARRNTREEVKTKRAQARIKAANTAAQAAKGPGALTRLRERIPHVHVAPLTVLLVATAALTIFGLVMVYSASSYFAMSHNLSSYYYLTRQLIWIVIGVAIAVVVAALNYRFFTSLPVVLVFTGIVFLGLLYTLVAGTANLGAQRWGDVSGFNFQISEFVKIAVLIVMAREICRYHLRRQYSRIACLVAMAMLLVPVVLERDLGTTGIALVLVLVLLWLSGLRLRWVLLIFGAIVVFGVIMVVAEPYRLSRALSFSNPWADPKGSGYQLINSWYAFANGGFFGVGIGNSTQKALYLTQPQTDFIFSIIGEETGVAGAMTVVIAFIAYVWSGLRIALSCQDLRGRLLAGGAAVIVGIQAFLNIFVTLGLFPTTGKTLPFISYGGSSMLAIMTLTGIIVSVALHHQNRSGRHDHLFFSTQDLGSAGASSEPPASSRPGRSGRSAETPQRQPRTSRQGSKSSSPDSFGRSMSSRHLDYPNKSGNDTYDDIPPFQGGARRAGVVSSRQPDYPNKSGNDEERKSDRPSSSSSSQANRTGSVRLVRLNDRTEPPRQGKQGGRR